jgi:anti-anti-sigma factor
MESSVQQFPDATLITIKGRIDHKSAKDFEEALKSHLGEDRTGSLVLDLGELEYMTSAGLRVLMIAAKTCGSQDRKLAVAALQPLIAEIFKISRFDLVLNIYPTVEDALQALSPDAEEG